MTTNWNETGNDRLLASLALALVDQPRASLQELAKAVGIGKSTLHRFCSTRDELVERMAQHGAYRLIEAAKAAKLDQDSPLEAFKRLNTTHFEQRELAAFLLHHWKAAEAHDPERQWESSLDAFFLRGQQQGVFRIDIAAHSLTEAWASLMIGLIEAERHGQIARLGLPALVETLFLHGAFVPPPSSAVAASHQTTA